MIKAICFDLDGVYFTPEGKKEFEKELVKLSEKPYEVTHLLYKSEEMLQFVKGELSEKQFFDHARNVLEIGLSDSEFKDLWARGYEINPEVSKLLLTCKQNGYLICLCSNNNIARVSALQDKFNFLDDFDVAIFSYKVGAVKPHKNIYSELIKATQLQPEQIVYSDDSPYKIQGAKDLGVTTFIYEDIYQFRQELVKLGVRI